MTPSARRTRLVALGAALVAVAAIAVPVLGQAARPAPAGMSAVAVESEKPEASPKSANPGKGDKKDKVEETPVTLTGTVGTRTDADGDTVYTLKVGSTEYDLEVGPPWWWGDKNPLKAHVGKTVKVEGEQAKGFAEIDVLKIDGTAIREPGRPPWAGGWKTVGEKHPGWSQWKADKAAAKANGQGHGRPEWAGPKGSDDPND